MSRAFLILANPDIRARAHHWIDIAPEGARIEFKQPKRTPDQNAKMWPLLADVSRQVEWYGQYLSPDDWKDMFTASLRKARVVPGIDPGSFVVLGMRTSKMSKAEFSDLIEIILCFCAERGVVLSDSKSPPDLAPMEPDASLPAGSADIARAQGFTGDSCPQCSGTRMVIAQYCLKPQPRI